MFYRGEILDGTYEILDRIGKGGTGVIYKAYHLRLKKYVVIKLLYSEKVNLDKVRVEVDTLKQLHHTCLPQVYDFFETKGQFYTVMDYIEGKDLEQYLREGRVFGEGQLLFWLKQLCGVLEYLHGQNPPIYHSDIKPANIMITSKGDVCLIDFNISLGSGSQDGILGASPWYAAPEQRLKKELFVRGEDSSGIVLDGRMDLYSLGACFYTLVSGLLPEEEGERIPLNSMELPYSDGFLRIIEKAMEYQPKRRYSSAAAFGRALDFIYKMDGGYRRLQRLGWILWGGCGLLITAGILLGVYGWQEMSREAYRKDYRAFYENVAKYEDQETISQGLDLLNNRRYGGILKKNPEDKAQILYMVGDVYYGLKEYALAEEYFQEAGKEDSNVLYYRDQAFAAAKQGKISQAERILEEAKREGLEGEQFLLAGQEIAFARQDMEKVQETGKVLENSQDKETASYSCLLMAKAYKSQGNYEKQAEYLEKAYAAGGDKRCLRELGSAYLELVKEFPASSRKVYLQRAGECYEKLSRSYGVSYQDQLNLAIIREELGEYEEARKLLEKMERSYPGEYQIYMHLSYSYLKEGEQTSKNGGEYEKALEYYRKAKNAYIKAGKPQDSGMQELEDYIENLQEEL